MKVKMNSEKHLRKTTVTMEDIEKMVDYYSSKASEYCHQLGIAGVVIVWALLNYATENGIREVKLIRISFLLFIITITISLLHYAILAIMSDHYYHKNEKKLSIDSLTELRKKHVENSKPIEKISWIFFGFKFITLLAGYFSIIFFIFSKVI